MPITYPSSRQQVITRIQTDVQSELPDADPFVRNSSISAIVVGYGGSVYDLNVNQQNLQDELFPDTADGAYGQRWGTLKNVYPNPATGAFGYISITGTLNTPIPVDTELQSSDGYVYTTNANVSIVSNVINVSSIILEETTATVTTTTSHNFGNTNTVTIAGAVPADYNLTTQISVIDDTTFSYQVYTSPISPPTGTITATCVQAVVGVITSAYPFTNAGSATNKSNGAELYFSSPISGVNTIAHVLADGLTGGADAEDAASYRSRYLYVYRNPISNFSVSDITARTKQLPFVDRVWVYPITPGVGQVTIYFTVIPSGGGYNVIPTPTQVETVKNNLLATPSIVPANVDFDNDVIVAAPIAVPVDFVFTSTDPSTSTMIQAIENNLIQVFAESTQVGVNFSQYLYQSAIAQSIDPVTGIQLIEFVLSKPNGNISVPAGYLATYSSIST